MVKKIEGGIRVSQKEQSENARVSYQAMMDILGNYIQVEESIVSQLNCTYANHRGTEGGFREEVWKELFEQIIPKKFVIEQSVFIIDSFGNYSREVDLAIFDETYTPYIFRKGRLRFIPIEAVAAVIECKSNSVRNLDEWLNSIKKLKTSREAVMRVQTKIAYYNKSDGATQTGTRPIRILCCLAGKGIRNYENDFDFILRVAKKSTKKISITYCPDKTLMEWYDSFNHYNGEGNKKDVSFGDYNKTLVEYEIKKDRENISFISFNMQFNQLLMLINNPIPFPHIAYVKAFNEAARLKKAEEDKKRKEEKEKKKKEKQKNKQKNRGKKERNA